MEFVEEARAGGAVRGSVGRLAILWEGRGCGGIAKRCAGTTMR